MLTQMCADHLSLLQKTVNWDGSLVSLQGKVTFAIYIPQFWASRDYAGLEMKHCLPALLCGGLDAKQALQNPRSHPPVIGVANSLVF